MAITAAVASVAVGAYSAYEQHEAQKDAREAQGRAADEQKKARQEQDAVNAQQRANERRAQLREERVKRAKIIQASANSGAMDSSGELGAVGNLATQRGTALGTNLGLAMHGANISNDNQAAANFMNEAQNHMVSANEWGQIGSLAMSFGSAAGSIFTPNPSLGSSQQSSIGPATGTIQEPGLQASGAQTFAIK